MTFQLYLDSLLDSHYLLYQNPLVGGIIGMLINTYS
jgi:hypothetical protein